MIERISQWTKSHGGAPVLIAIFFAITLQVQVTILSDGDYLGLRLGLSDFFIPLCGLFVLASLLLKKTAWPKWNVPYMWGWLGALIAVMTMGLINGYVQNGFWDSWALLNKYVGFYILLAYFALGSWLMRNSDAPNALIKQTMRGFCLFYTAMIALSFLDMLWMSFGHQGLTLGNASWDGLMANRNAFAVLGIAILLFGEIDQRKEKVLPVWGYNLFLLLLPTYALFNASRTAWIIGGLVVLFNFWGTPLKDAFKKIALLALGTALLFGILNAPKLIREHGSLQLAYLVKAIENPTDPGYLGDQNRLIAVEDGLELFGQSSPIIGAGLGTYKHFQIEKRGKFVDVIDFTSLWILTEFGILGTLVFSGFFLACLWSLRKSLDSDFHRALFIFMILFFVMSCLHELMYARFIWFILGMGLAIPTKNEAKS